MTKKILVVDDEKSILDLVKRILLRQKYDVVTAVNGREALEKVASESPDLVVLDIMMPELNGLQVCRKLKGDPSTSHIPVIILSVKGNYDDQIKGLDLGGDEYMTKPFYPKELLLRVKKLLKA